MNLKSVLVIQRFHVPGIKKSRKIPLYFHNSTPLYARFPVDRDQQIMFSYFLNFLYLPEENDAKIDSR